MPRKRSTPKTFHRAWELRKEFTPAEKTVWVFLRVMRDDGINFRRQHAIRRSVTRVTEHLNQENHDQERTQFLESQGYKVIRFWNNVVLNNLKGVLSAIHEALEESLFEKMSRRLFA